MAPQRLSLKDLHEQINSINSPRGRITKKPPSSQRMNDHKPLAQQQRTETQARTSVPSAGHNTVGRSLKTNDHWWVELLATAIGGAIVTAIAMLLKYYDGKPVPNWPVSVSMHT